MYISTFRTWKYKSLEGFLEFFEANLAGPLEHGSLQTAWPPFHLLSPGSGLISWSQRRCVPPHMWVDADGEGVCGRVFCFVLNVGLPLRL